MRDHCNCGFGLSLHWVYSLVGVLGIKVKIMLPWDDSGKTGPKKPLPDNVSIVEPKDETPVTAPYSESKQMAPAKSAMPTM